jgi:hypothetical protein
MVDYFVTQNSRVRFDHFYYGKSHLRYFRGTR